MQGREGLRKDGRICVIERDSERLTERGREREREREREKEREIKS